VTAVGEVMKESAFVEAAMAVINNLRVGGR